MATHALVLLLSACMAVRMGLAAPGGVRGALANSTGDELSTAAPGNASAALGEGAGEAEGSAERAFLAPHTALAENMASGTSEATEGSATGQPVVCSWMPWLPRCQALAPAPAPGRSPGSCALYGCMGYNPAALCQCNGACSTHGSCCHDYAAKCSSRPAPSPSPAPSPPPAGPSGRVVTVYHQTSPAIGPLILAGGFQPGTAGWCGGGIYFAATPAATYTKAIGTDSHQGYIIEARVDLGRLKEMPETCDTLMTGGQLSSMGYDSIRFNPGDGDEYIVYSSTRVLSARRYA